MLEYQPGRAVAVDIGSSSISPSRETCKKPYTGPSINQSDATSSRQENIGRVKWDEFRRNGDDALEEDVSTFIPTWKKALKLLKILLPHVGLNILLLSYIAMGAIMFIWLEADHELQNRKVDSRLRPLLRILSRTHEYDDKFTESGQLWIDTEAEMTTRDGQQQAVQPNKPIPMPVGPAITKCKTIAKDKTTQ
ncbi:hypothetical protein TELCIR_04872 [Teladorsagia circumcincta]|uniref:Uncharacterized protein n=1 Tax=Teladorsagia circumcincta TaxID=45464 RepID=A0A2G9USF3_TELCI|nr:hypothetical protein TELCIR_04872 [Teladorsagia circumcincta]